MIEIPDCTDWQRHERILGCDHRTALDPARVMVTFTDGCSGDICAGCDLRHGVRRQPDLKERLAGPPSGLAALRMVRALYGRRA